MKIQFKETFIDENTRINSETSSSQHVDGQIPVFLYYKDKCVACSSLSQGLHEYYDYEFFSDLCEKIKSEWIIVQMQKLDSQFQGNYRKFLTKFIIDAAVNYKLPRLYFMSAAMNYWNLAKVRNSSEEFLRFPSEQTFLYDYDWNAKKQKFNFDSATGLYLRNL